ncbi:cyclic nucleotide-binding domain protein (macronuclear) [Tetrahymena thermophila SB210]|uniref:Cyclic nucleotide-binding domain protein n=1 Tax=Tetrahymena thermophila (strain SB210) TaxID=312017 RepID=Q23VA9_TETTS|nr:cyclic nucleotide-binding domain protein [Tetrahymena thermophila SB210]EAS00473.2 cyclic nucleotide-binding domain protein [Tetrahymena thermophila SB210]|eukprot:XP_001020718.2 cyclic nucleotide-binding domain protein [Tetrahymena thermophila SB210]
MVIDSKLDTLNQRLDESIVSEGDQIPNLTIVQQAQHQQLNVNLGLQINEQRSKMPSINIMNNSIQNKSTDIIELKNNFQISQNNESFQKKFTEKHVKIDNSMNKYFSLRGEENLVSITEENKQKVEQNQSQNVLPILLKLKMNLTNKESKINKNLRVSNKKIRKFINDISDNFFERESFYLQCCAKIYSCFSFKQFQNKTFVPLFHPQSNLKIAMDIFFCLINCLFFYFSSILITFQVDLDIGSDIYNIMYIVWLLQLSIELNTAIYQKSNLIQACLWYLLGVLELHYFGEEKTWFDEGIAADKNWIKLYVCSLYWSLTLMTTGSNVAQTISQASFTSFIMLITTIIFGYLVNIIGIILTEADQEEEKQRRDINQINKYMRKRQISKTLQRAINLDLEYYYHHNYKKDDELNQQVLSKISNNLLHDLKEQYFGKILDKIPFLSCNFSHETLQKLSMVIEEESYLPGQVINDNISQPHNKLIYIVEGSVKLVRQVCEYDYEQAHINDNNFVGKEQVLGEVQFFGGVNEGMIYQACDFTRILTIQRDKFLETIRQNEKDLQVFCSIREKVGLYQDYEVIKLACKVCFKNKHQQEHCPLVHFDKSDYTIKENFFLNQKQIRQDWDRKKKAQPNAIMNQPLVEEKQREHQKNTSKNNQNQLCPKRERFLALSTIQSKDLDQQYRCSSDAQRSCTQSKIEDFEDDQKVQNSEYQIQRQRQMSTQKYKNPNRTNVSINQNIDDENVQEYTTKERKSNDQQAIMSQNLDYPYQSQQIQSSQQNLNIKDVANLNYLQNQQIYYPMNLDQRIDRIEDLLKNLTKEQINKVIQGQDKLFASENIQNNKNNQQSIIEIDQKRDYDIYFPYGNSYKIISEYNQKIRFNVRKLKTSKLRK